MYDFRKIEEENREDTIIQTDECADANGLEYCYFNPNIRNKVTKDCVKRAICVATAIDYKDVEVILNKNKKYPKLTYASPLNHEYVIENILNGVRVNMNVSKGSKKWRVNTINRIMGKYPNVNYILGVSRHLIGVRNQTIYDLFDDRHGNKAINVMWLFNVEPNQIDKIRKELSKGDKSFVL